MNIWESIDYCIRFKALKLRTKQEETMVKTMKHKIIGEKQDTKRRNPDEYGCCFCSYRIGLICFHSNHIEGVKLDGDYGHYGFVYTEEDMRRIELGNICHRILVDKLGNHVIRNK